MTMRIRGIAQRRRRAKAQSNDHGVLGILKSLRSLGPVSLNRRLILIASCSFVSGLSQAMLLVLISELAISHVQGSNHLKVHGFSLSVTDAILACFALLVLFCVASLTAASASSSLASSTVEASRGKLIDSFFTSSWKIQSAERLGHIQQLLTINCHNIGYLTLAMSSGLQAALSASALLLAAFVVDPVTASIVIVAGVILSSAMRPSLNLSRKASSRLSDDSRRMATLVTEYTRLAREFRLFGVEDAATDQLQERNRVAAVSLQRVQLLGLVSPVVYQTLALGFVIAGLAIVIGRSGGNLGATGAILLLVLRSLTYGSQIQSNSQQIRSFQGFLDGVEADIKRYAESQPELSGSRNPESFDIKFSEVSFAYNPGVNVLKNISFYVPSGNILGVVGRSGSGKTTLSQLVLGMRGPTDGFALVGDVPAASMAKGRGVSPIALVAQESILLQGSIASNISFFRDVSQEQIEEASRAAHFHEDVVGMTESYATLVGEGGGALSGGQRQRLAIARALVGSPRVLVLDEPTSALDGRSESLIRQTLSELRGRVTVVVISHRLSMVEVCDLLLVLNRGQLADFGPCDEIIGGAPFRHVAEAVAVSDSGSL